MAYEKHLVENLWGVDFVLPLIAYMTPQNPQERPTAAECVTRFNELQAKMSRTKLLQRVGLIRNGPEGTTIRAVKNVYHWLCEGWWVVEIRRKFKPLDAYYSAGA